MIFISYHIVPFTECRQLTVSIVIILTCSALYIYYALWPHISHATEQFPSTKSHDDKMAMAFKHGRTSRPSSAQTQHRATLPHFSPLTSVFSLPFWSIAFSKLFLSHILFNHITLHYLFFSTWHCIFILRNWNHIHSTNSKVADRLQAGSHLSDSNSSKKKNN